MAIDKNKIIEAATKFVQKGQFDKAIKEYVKLLELDPKDARIQQKLGELYQKKGDNPQAAECFLKVAESYAADGFFLKAVAVYKQVLKLNPDLVEVNLKLAELHQQLGLMSDAMAQFQLVANHYEKSGDIKASLDTLRKMVDLDPDNVASRIKLAELYARENANAEAIAEFGRAAEYLKRNNRVDDYVKVAERLVFLDPSNVELTRELANIYLTKQDTKRALAKLQLCFKADPKDVETLTMLAQAFKDLGQISKTVSVYKELAKIYDEGDKVDEEKEVWKKIAELAPDDPDARARMPRPAAQAASPAAAPAQNQGQAQAQGQAAQPQAARGAAPAAAPRGSVDQIPRLLTETDVYVKYGLHEKAIEHLKKVFAIDPDSVDGHEKAAQLLSDTGHPQGALESLVKVVRLCIAKGDLERARVSLQKLCEKEPTHPEIPGFLNAVGGLAPEEVAEIEEDAILVDAGDESVEVGPEPQAEDLSLEPSGAPEEDEPLEEAAADADADADDAALAAAAASIEADQPQGEFVAEAEELIAAAPEDDLALSQAQSAAGASEPESLVPDVEDVETSFADVAAASETPAPFDLADGGPELSEDTGEAEAQLAEGEPLEGPGSDPAEVELQPTMPGKVSFASAAAARLPPEEDVHEEATRVAHLPSLLAAEAAAKADPKKSQAATLETDIVLEDEIDTTAAATVPPRKATLTRAPEPASPRTQPNLRNAKETLAAAAKQAQKSAAAVKKPEPVRERVKPAPEPEPEPAQGEDAAGDELEEASFFVEQGMFEEAREILETVLLAYPDSPRAKELLGRVEDGEAGGAVPPAAAAEPAVAAEEEQPLTTDASFDLASELAKEDLSGLGDLGPGPSDDFQYSVEDVFDEFKKGLKKVVKPEDVETHYDLGIAYKEMGLLEDGIGEFEQAAAAAAGKKKEIDSLVMVGLCRIEKGELVEAAETFQRTLALPQVTSESAKAVHFELALVLEKMGKAADALHHFQKVQKIDAKFRDVAQAIARVESLAGAEEERTEPSGKTLKPSSNGSSAKSGGSKPEVATGPEEPNPPGGPKGKKARKIGYV